MKYAWAIIGAGLMFSKDPHMVTRGFLMLVAAVIVSAIEDAVERIKVK